MNFPIRTFFTLMLCLSVSNLVAQVEEFGKLNKNELLKKTSEIDQSAEAEVLFETSETVLAIIGGHFEITVRNHTRIKIFNEKGLDEANIRIRYIDKGQAEHIQKLEAQTYNLDEGGNIKVTKLDKKNVFEKVINNRMKETAFGFPEVKSGSVIEYRYTLKRKILYVDEWSFQRHIPVIYSSVKLQYPPEFRFTPVPRAYQKIENSFEKAAIYDIQSYSMSNVPALKHEPFISSDEDYLQRIKFSLHGYFSDDLTIKLARNWPDVIKELLDDQDFGEQLRKNIPRTKELDAQISVKKSEYEKMITIHDYVKQIMVWDGKTSIWATDGVKNAWDKKTGNSGEINLILVNLLKEAGLKANPILVSTRENGRVMTTDPGIEQFNTVMAYVTIDSSTFVLDATDKRTPAMLIPPSVVLTEGLVINKYDNATLAESDWGWKMLWNENKLYYKLVNISGTLGTDGKVKGSAFIINRDYARLEFLEKHNADSVSISGAYKAMHSNISLNEIKSNNDQIDSLPFEQTLAFEFPAEENGDYRIININLFTGLQNNPFLAENRSSDIFFGYNQKFLIRGGYNIPGDYVVEDLPKNVRMVTPDKSVDMTRIMQKTGNNVTYSIILDFKKPYYLIEEYKDFAEFYKQLNTVLNEPIVVRKTSKP
ncbi:MAG TPA: DUF3857 domain-containing protein [Chitinophagaceae bacterium]|nr:DUF3857 domain-containing protein [Chitinophagaceae bacterium]